MTRTPYRTQRIANDTTPNGYLISTVELSNGTFETMVFKGQSHLDLWCERTSNEAQARCNHSIAYDIFCER